jgi:glycosyltransferase involved in cell wall biosynthesis
MMPTYNRIGHPSRCVDESVEAFLRQDYPHKELIIFNDCAQQTISYDHPQIKVVNTKTRSSCLSDAYNRTVAESTGDLLTIWTDDDIRLPWTLTTSLEALENNKYAHAHFGPFFYASRNTITGLANSLIYQTGLFTRRIFDDLGGYTLPLTQEHDMDFDERLWLTGKSRGTVMLPPNKAFLIYRWDDGHLHLSGAQPRYLGDTTQYMAQAKRPVDHGHHTIRPIWLKDYTAEARNFLSK